MLHVFKNQLDQRLTATSLPSAVVQSVQTQSNKLAAIKIPANQDAKTRNNYSVAQLMNRSSQVSEQSC